MKKTLNKMSNRELSQLFPIIIFDPDPNWIALFNEEKMMFLKEYTENGFQGQAYHIHVRYSGDWDEIYFRDYLLANPDVAKEYGELKVQLAKQYKNDREEYTKSKTEFIKRITEVARKSNPE